MTALLCHHGHRFAYLDAKRVLYVDEDHPTGPCIMWEKSQEKLNALLDEFGCWRVSMRVRAARLAPAYS